VLLKWINQLGPEEDDPLISVSGCPSEVSFWSPARMFVVGGFCGLFRGIGPVRIVSQQGGPVRT
jgi:hypothetical protein